MSVESLPSPLPRPRPWVMKIFLLVLVLVAAMPPLVVFYTDWLWYRELGYQQIFMTSLLARAGIVVATGLTVALFLMANFGVALRGLRIPLLMVKGPGQEPSPFVIEGKQLKLVAFGDSVRSCQPTRLQRVRKPCSPVGQAGMPNQRVNANSTTMNMMIAGTPNAT